MTTFYQQEHRPEPQKTDRELVNTLVDIARAGAGLPPGGLAEAAAQAGAEVRVVNLRPVLSLAARAARARIILAVYDYTQERDRQPRDYRALAEAQDNWLKTLDRELKGLEATKC